MNGNEILSDLARRPVEAAKALPELTSEQLNAHVEIIDTNWTPPVTRGVRIISIIDDAIAHIGQAAYADGALTG
ncbi:MAG: hypothetical protein QM658_04845 [Gordonia sp. (in: high G+C Gram-positive bacteria)]